MIVEITALMGAILAALGTAYGAFKASDKPIGRRLTIIACILAIIGLLSGFELSYRAWQIQQQQRELERSWLTVQSLPVKSVDFEVLVDKGSVNSESLRQFASGIQFYIIGTELKTQLTLETGTQIATIFAPDNLKREGFAGISIATIRKFRNASENNGLNSKIIDSYCVLSQSQARSDGSNSPFLRQIGQNQVACAFRAAIDVSKDNLTIGELMTAKQITVTTPSSMPHPCFGPCKNLIVSVRAILPSIDSLTPFMLEISPSAYLAQPNKIVDGRATFSLPGATLAELAKSYFMQSYAFRNRDSFPLTLGAVWSLYAWITESKETIVPIDMIWTNGWPDEDVIKNLMPQPQTDRVLLAELPEWCGFGRERHCWRRYIVFRPIKPGEAR